MNRGGRPVKNPWRGSGRVRKVAKPNKSEKLNYESFDRSLLDYPRELLDLIAVENPVIFEIGCNDGADTEKMLRIFPHSVLHCFEVDPRAITKFENRKLNCSLHKIAISDSEGESTFHQSSGTSEHSSMEDWDMSGSLNKPLFHLEQSPWCKFENTIKVPTITLDRFLEVGSPEIGYINLLWVDVQGGESKVFKGGHEALHLVEYLYTEFCHCPQPLYEGSMTLEQTCGFLGSKWELIGVYEGYNALFRNKEA